MRVVEKGTKVVWIVQPYVPRYRVAFFERLAEKLREDNIELRIVASTPEATQKERADAASPQWLTTVAPRTLRVGSRSIVLTSTSHFWKEADGVIVPLVGSSLDVYSALLRRRRGRLAVGLWGHVMNYVSDDNALDLWLEKQQMRHADYVFAYTSTGARFAQAQGVDARRVTALMNTVDLDTLRRAMSDVVPADVASFRDQWGLDEKPVIAYIGGIDEGKRIDLLVGAMERAWHLRPDLAFLIAGSGRQVELLQPAIDRGQAVYIGQAGDREKALIASSASVLANPGRVGLIAAEALAMRLHLVTTRWRYHAPEIEYLVEGADVTFTEPTADAFADALIAEVDNNECRVGSSAPELDDMVENFRRGVQRMLDR